MYSTTSKEKILENIRNALSAKANKPFPSMPGQVQLYKQSDEPDDIAFALELRNLGGNFVYCVDEKELCNNLTYLTEKLNFDYIYCSDNNLIEFLKRCNIPHFSSEKNQFDAPCSLTSCEYLISRTGSILISAQNKCERSKYFFSPYHFVVAYTSQLVKDLDDALKKIKSKYSILPDLLTIVSGPSRTADIEKTLVMGAHGPKELYLFLIDDQF